MRTSKIRFLLLLTVFPLWCIFPQNNISKLNRQFSQPCNRKYNQIQLDNFSDLKYSIDLVVPKKVQFQKQTQVFPDSIINLSQNYANSKYIFHQEGGKISAYILSFFNSGQWEETVYFHDTYNSNGSLDSIFTQWWTNGSWVDDTRASFTYDSSGNNIGYFEQHFSNGNWVNASRDIYTYNSFNKIDLSEVWDGNKWVYGEKDFYYFDSHGLLDSSFREIWQDNNFVNDRHYIYSKDSSGYYSTVIEQIWTDSEWVNSSASYYLYDSKGNNTSLLYQKWDGSSWNNDSRYFYSYNSDNLFTYGRCEIWQSGEWRPGDGFFGDLFWKDWGIGSFGTEQTLYYSITSINEKNIDKYNFHLSQNYPNPFNPSTVINYSIPANGFIQIKVFDVLGKEIKILVNEFKNKGNYKIKFDGSNLASGIYFYTIKSGSNFQTKKMILQK